MWKILLNVLFVFLHYNQQNSHREYHLLVYKTHIAHHEVEMVEVKPRLLNTKVDVREPTLDQLEALGFNVARE